VSQPDVCAVALLRGDNAALLQLRDDKPGLRAAGCWVFPGGHAENGETLEAGARREFLEETSYRCRTLIPLLTLQDVFYPGWPSYPLHFFLSSYDGQQRWECREGQELRFVGRDEAEKIPMPAYQVCLWDLAILYKKAFSFKNLR